MRSKPGPSLLPGLYVHVPFCRKKCFYCDFYSVTEKGLDEAWLASIRREIDFYKDRFGGFSSLYVGGGTPTCLDDGKLAALFEILGRHLTFHADCEVTIEANPDDLDGPRCRMLKSLGCNRLSLGVQSFDDGELALLGRRHDAKGAAGAVEAAIAAGFSNIGLDLIYCLPGQTERSWRLTLERALSFKPAHLSCYQLTVEGRTPLSRMVSGGGLVLPGEKEARKFFLTTSRFLESAGFIHYEVSNFAASRERLCRHNEKYWRRVPYLGLGPSAHSFDGLTRWWNHRSLRRYLAAAVRGKRPVAGHETLSEEQTELEMLYLGLRTRRGIKLADLGARALPALSELRRARLVRVRGDRVAPSRLGYLVADSLPALLC